MKAIPGALRRRRYAAAAMLLGWTLLTAACAAAPDAVGRWREVGRTATLVLQADGRFAAVDNEGLAVSGIYTLAPNGRARFEIVDAGRVVDVVHLTLTIQGDQMTIRPAEDGKAEHYRRTP